jgi:EAL domain-containing protein (putative c-di-GMP-specific phosphodiesterase class I)
LGVQLNIDDFGTGYSSLSRLQQFPIDALKIDQCFVRRLGTSSESLAIVRAIITLASTLGIEVVAEGIETEQQKQQLQELACEKGQGYLFSAALPVHRAQDLIAKFYPYSMSA